MVSASQIARLGFCEHQIRLDAVQGRRTTEAQRAARRQGDQAHQAFYCESQRLAARSERRGKCFIATLALGESPETTALRQFRDLFLRRTALGRWFIAAYYSHSPSVCDALAQRPRLLGALTIALKGVARLASVMVQKKLPRETRHGG
jgi:hypothetical protein